MDDYEALKGRSRRPRPLQRAQERWKAPCEPAGEAPRPEGLPPCGTDATGKNKAAVWLRRAGWWPLGDVARLYNADRAWLRRQAERGRLPFLRVGQYAYFVRGEDIGDSFEELSDSGTYLAWIEAGCSVQRDDGGRT